MNRRFKKMLIAAIAGGLGFILASSVVAYWHLNQRQWCLQFTSAGGQEVTYSRGCHNPKRYKQWAVTAESRGQRAEG